MKRGRSGWSSPTAGDERRKWEAMWLEQPDREHGAGGRSSRRSPTAEADRQKSGRSGWSSPTAEEEMTYVRTGNRGGGQGGGDVGSSSPTAGQDRKGGQASVARPRRRIG